MLGSKSGGSPACVYTPGLGFKVVDLGFRGIIRFEGLD